MEILADQQAIPLALKKSCRKCKLELDRSEFGKCAARADGLQNQCKPCQKTWRDANRRLPKIERATKTCVQCLQTKAADEFAPNNGFRDGRDCYCKPCVRDRGRKYRAANLEQVRENEQRYVERNREFLRALSRAWKRNNPERHRESNRRWEQQNRDKCVNKYNRRRALKLNAAISDFTAAEWALMKRLFGYACFYCARSDVPMTQDHVTPLTRGGDHTWDNIVPACRSCNGRKSDKTLEEYVAWLVRCA